jgi:hypothetical protein
MFSGAEYDEESNRYVSNEIQGWNSDVSFMEIVYK